MKNLRWILFAFVAMMAWGACSDDETFAPPMIGGGEAANETLISLDTASTFMIERSIASEKGLQSVTLRDVTNDKVIDAVTSFTNPNQYAYSYAFWKSYKLCYQRKCCSVFRSRKKFRF